MRPAQRPQPDRARLCVGLLLLALAALALSLLASSATAQPSRTPRVWLPLMADQLPPTGVYDCVESEFGLLWTTSVITLSGNLSSQYNYGPPYSGLAAGAWSYTPSIQEVRFTNFRWEVLRFIPPGRLNAMRFIESGNFTVRIDCTRR